LPGPYLKKLPTLQRNRFPDQPERTLPTTTGTVMVTTYGFDGVGVKVSSPGCQSFSWSQIYELNFGRKSFRK
jgi:hypothetical protein